MNFVDDVRAETRRDVLEIHPIARAQTKHDVFEERVRPITARLHRAAVFTALEGVDVRVILTISI